MSDLADVQELVVDTMFGTVEAFEAAFGPRVGPASLFCGVGNPPPLGRRVHLVLRLSDRATVALAARGFVAWRYPPMAVPPGREAGIGLMVEEVEAPYRARFAHLAAERLARPFQIPGTRLARRLEGGVAARAAAAERAARSLPSAHRPLPAAAAPPAISGTAFVVASKTRKVKHVERVEWPDIGTKRESSYGNWDEDDTLTGDAGFDPFGDAGAGFDDPWNPPPEERTDPRRISQVVEKALGATRLTDFADDILNEPTPEY